MPPNVISIGPETRARIVLIDGPLDAVNIGEVWA